MVRPVDRHGRVARRANVSTTSSELKRLLLRDERAFRAIWSDQFVLYATGAPVRFGDRAEIEAILDRGRGNRLWRAIAGPRSRFKANCSRNK